MAKPIHVMVVDDSAVVRQVVSDLLSRQPDIDVIGAASDPIFALKKMEQFWPDVILLDVEMPRMDGITFLKKIMSERPTPVIICSTLTGKGSETAMQALSAGAVAVITKPTLGLKNFLTDSSNDLVTAVRAAAGSNCRALRASWPSAPAVARTSAPAGDQVAMAETTDRIIAIGTSTGGTQALEAILTRIPRTTPGIVIVQHMPEKFTALFAQRLNQICDIEVLEAIDGMRVLPGRAIVAPGGRHMTLVRSGAQYQVKVMDGPPVNRHKPSVDVLFRSVAKCAGKNATGVILTGMGGDGARGLKEMLDQGAYTVAQDEATSIVFGMPKEAIALNAVNQVLPLQKIPELLARGGIR
ncbi:MAG: chemotaxis response regulator protein-glutamate methylesterase [Hahellaceae bacterium]|nr:chemotaxis response regulator protein-glutamate methylesterase [Hahellaceae bacterium]MCP5168382.1 chemotaxis response regulator protein-glutamate methylesterase [Hahellaceae bacterium]